MKEKASILMMASWPSDMKPMSLLRMRASISTGAPSGTICISGLAASTTHAFCVSMDFAAGPFTTIASRSICLMAAKLMYRRLQPCVFSVSLGHALRVSRETSAVGGSA